MSEYDTFIDNSPYPNAADVFALQLKPIEDIKDDCVFVLDTNVLLVPYTASSESLEQMRAVYSTLIQDQRLVIPAQVAREFADNRPAKLQELFQQLHDEKSLVHKISTGSYPLLEGIQAYQDALDLEEKINELIREYGRKIRELADHIKNWTWNDPVSQIYNELFSADVVVELQMDREEIEQELKRRYEHRIPPGYKDKSKPDAGVGDLLIWYTVLEVAKTRKKDVILVSGDEKSDWFHRSMGQSLYPRYELATEFMRETDGKSFHILNLSQFLDLHGVDEEIVREIEEVQDFARWIDEIVHAFESLGGKARYLELYEFIESTTTRDLPRTWQATIRYTIQLHSSDTGTYKGGPDLFRPLDRGYWALRSYSEDKDSEEDGQR